MMLLVVGVIKSLEVPELPIGLKRVTDRGDELVLDLHLGNERRLMLL